MARASQSFLVSWSDVALEDAYAIVDYVATEVPDRALALLDLLERRADSLDQHPNRGRVVPELAAMGIDQFRELIEGPYRILYEIHDDPRRVSVVAVIDGRRNVKEVLRRRKAGG